MGFTNRVLVDHSTEFNSVYTRAFLDVMVVKVEFVPVDNIICKWGVTSQLTHGYWFTDPGHHPLWGTN